MPDKSRVWRGVTAVGAALLSVAVVSAMTLEMYRTSVDAALGTRSQQTVTNISSKDNDNTWNYKSSFKTAQDAYDGFKKFALREGEETNVLLKNDSQALPLKKDAKITMFGVRSFAPVYGSSGGSVTDGNATVQITDAFKEKGFQINPSMLKAYQSYFAGQEWTKPKFGSGIIPEYASITAYDNPHELSLDALKKLNPDYASEYKNYNDAAIVVVGRPAGENGDGYYPGSRGLADGVHTVTGNILSLSDEEMALIHEAESNFDKVIVLVNSTNPMEIANLQNDPHVDAIMWIGFPGAYGFYGVADTLNGTINPSGALGDVYAKNSALAPAMVNYGDIPWKNASSFSEAAAVNSYLIEAEGIYTGYRYYETRYADIMSGRGGAQAAAGTYAAADGTVATGDGTWDYANEVVYPFGYGLSYTTFEQKLNSVSVTGDKKTARAEITVKNTGKVAGKTAVQLYASAPYTQYDKDNGVEKSAIQLADFEKSQMLKPGESQTITMNVDMSVLASYDAQKAKTYILDPGQYWFAVGANAHDAMNSVLSAQGVRVQESAQAQSVQTDSAQQWTMDGDVDTATFATSRAGKKITNKLSEGDYATDFNAFQPGTVTYLSRKNWEGTFPQTYAGLTADGRLAELLKNDFIPLKTGENTSDIKFGDTSSALTINDMKGASYDDERWSELINKVTLKEYLNFAANAFHAIGGMPSIGLPEMTSDDGPGGSDSHLFSEGQYQGTAYADGEKYNTGTRVAPSPVNLAYAWNKELAYENGQMLLGESTLILNLPIMIGPAMNLHRHAYNSRGVEYYSEDPVLSGYTGSAVVQGAQSKGTLVNVKHLAFNDQEINRSGIAVFMNEQKARELELRNFQQAFEGNGEPASFAANTATNANDPNNANKKAERYGEGARGVMSSYNRIGAVAPSANRSVMVDILRDEWGFKGYNVTDFTSISLKAAPKESTLAGTVAFCGFGPQGITYWTESGLSGDRNMLLAMKQNLHYALYALANSAVLNGVNSSTHTVNKMTSWRMGYIAGLVVAAALVLSGVAGYAVTRYASVRARRTAVQSVGAQSADAQSARAQGGN